MPLEHSKLAISLVTYNGEKYLPFCLKSLFKQTFRDFNLLIIDNGSTDRTLSYLKENYPQLKVVSHKENLGYARAHNQAIGWTKSDYVMLLNQDIFLNQDYLEKAVSYLEENREVASLTGKILFWDYSKNYEAQNELLPFKTKIIDSLGLKVFKNHRVIDLGQGEKDKGQYDEVKEIFGVSGALPIYRRLALESVKVKINQGLNKAEYLDEDFFAYKEDIDLAYRLRLAGYQSVYLPEAVAYHDRSVKGKKNLSDKTAALGRKDRNKMIRIYSYKNHLLTILKNEFWQNMIKYYFQIKFYEWKKFFYILFFEPSTLRGLRMFYKQKSRILKKRKYIIKNIRKIKAEDLAKWYE